MKSMTHEEYGDLFATDEDDCFINLIIPAQGNKPELNLIGKKPKEFTVEEVIRMKKYASKMYDMIEE